MKSIGIATYDGGYDIIKTKSYYLCKVTMIIKATLEHFPVKPYQNISLHIQSDLKRIY